jgi:hypothetical protein
MPYSGEHAAMARKLVGLITLSAIVAILIAGSAKAFQVTCTSNLQSMGSIAINTTYYIYTEGWKEASDPSDYIIHQGQLALYSLTTGGSGSGDWVYKGANTNSATTWNVMNQEHDIYVSWQSRINIYDTSPWTYIGTLASSNPGPFYTP